MTFAEYQQESRKTVRYSRENNQHIYYVTLGLVGEAGEIANKVKKIMRDDNNQITPEKREAIRQELGDVLWYLSQLSSELDITLDDVAHENLEKLFSRMDRGVLNGSGDNR